MPHLRSVPVNSDQPTDTIYDEGVNNEISENGSIPIEEDTATMDNADLDDVQWQDQLAKYSAYGMMDKDVVQEHRTYVRKIHMIKDVARKCIKVFEYILT